MRTSERTPAPDPRGRSQAPGAPASASAGAPSALDLPSLQRQVAQAPSGGRVILDLSAAQALSGLEAASVLRLVMAGRERGVVVLLSNLQPGARQAFTGLSADLLGGPSAEEEDGLFLVEQVGNEAASAYKTGKNLLALIGDFFHFALVAPLRGKGIKWDRTFQQLERVGADAVPIVLFLSYLIGTVLALNGASQLRQFGAAIYIADLVGVAMTREMGPLITAIIVCGRSGSAITAELGTMVVSEEIDAMRTMALSPGRFLLVPRVLALLWAMPFLTLGSNFAGILGGYVVGVFLLELGSINYITETAEALLLKDLVTGLTKSLVFALIIGFTACYRGFHVRGGAEGVGTSTTSSVVTSIILCIVANAVFTSIFYHWR